jgi:hypothetical protein
MDRATVLPFVRKKLHWRRRLAVASLRHRTNRHCCALIVVLLFINIALDKESHMSTIIAGRFQGEPEVQHALDELQRAGFSPDKLASFYVNPPGQHDAYPIGGDHDRSPGAKETDKGAAIGAAAGAAIGAATVPLLGPVGPITGGLLGAYVGSLAGGLSEMKEKGDEGTDRDTENIRSLRHSGMMVAVSADDDSQRDTAIRTLRALGAEDIEVAQGTIRDGDWVDFDPVAPPALVNGESVASQQCSG